MRAPVTVLLAALLAGSLVTGCSSDHGCDGRTYHPDLDQRGATSPISALDDWLGTDPKLADPPTEGWTVVDPGDAHATSVVITNETGDGWWVSAARTSPGGWVVDQATDDVKGCRGQLSGLS